MNLAVKRPILLCPGLLPAAACGVLRSHASLYYRIYKGLDDQGLIWIRTIPYNSRPRIKRIKPGSDYKWPEYLNPLILLLSTINRDVSSVPWIATFSFDKVPLCFLKNSNWIFKNRYCRISWHHHVTHPMIWYLLDHVV